MIFKNCNTYFLKYCFYFTGTLNRVNILTTDSPYIIQTGALSSSLSEEQGETLDVNNSTNLEVVIF